MYDLLIPNKNLPAHWNEYEPFKEEPVIHYVYEPSPELDREVVDNGYLLKRRVWRQMKKMQKNQKPAYGSWRKYRARQSSRPAHDF